MALGHANISAALRLVPNVYVHDVCLDMRIIATSTPTRFDTFCREAVEKIRLNRSDLVCFGAFVWNEPFVQSIGRQLKELGQQIMVGGPQITYTPAGQLEALYPFADLFVRGYAENAVSNYARLLAEGKNRQTPITGIHHKGSYDMGLQASVSLLDSTSPFLDPHPLIDLSKQKFIRWESQRGCPFKCTFCQHKDSYTARIPIGTDRISSEISAFLIHNVQDIAVLNPTFNAGTTYLNILRQFHGYKGKLSLQCRFEMVTEEFLNACADLQSQGCKVQLEFGVQTTEKAEAKVIRRANQLEVIAATAEKLHGRDLSFEISLIYGLPLQTVASFERSISFCSSLKPSKLVAWPLMLLRGTELYSQKVEFGMVEEKFLYDEDGSLSEGANKRTDRLELGIPHVVASNSFSHEEWRVMREIASKL